MQDVERKEALSRFVPVCITTRAHFDHFICMNHRQELEEAEGELERRKQIVELATQSLAYDMKHRKSREVSSHGHARSSSGVVLQHPLSFQVFGNSFSSPERMQAYNDLVEEQKNIVKEYTTQLAGAKATLDKLSKIQIEASHTLQSVAVKITELQPVIDQDKVLHESSERLSALLSRLRASGVAMEDNTSAVEYAEELLVVLADMLVVDVLKEQLADGQLRVLKNVLTRISISA